MKQDIKWIKYSLTSTFFIILVITIFNYRVDSLGIFGNSSYLLDGAKALTNGKMIAGLRNYDERAFQALIIKNLKVKNDIIAIGSSRSLQIRKRFVTHKKDINFFNHSVTGAILNDYISIIGAYESIKGYLPSTIILGIDPWIFNKNSEHNKWQSISEYYNFEIAKIYNKKPKSRVKINTTKWKQLINYDYTLANINFFKTLLKNGGKAFYITNRIDIDDTIKESDGSRHYEYKRRYIKEDRVKREAIKYTQGKVYLISNYNKLSNIKLFEDFIKYLKSRGVNIIFYLPPYNPISYDILSKNRKYRYIDIVEKYLKKFAKEMNIELKGSYNPHIYNFKNRDFADGMHSHDEVVKKIFE
ncbi:conserved hypothetical protein [hydrothermal vent metagenome]|uniref:Uncharacterized protein n=1 Tax=hydrothermal vent metagenome TaxID=652676 RepID=A0A1W1EJC6_9ZZZZ